MQKVAIEEVSIDSLGRLVVRPQCSFDADYAFVYRAGMGVDWNGNSRSLVSRPPEKWSYADWFDQIRAAVLGEYRHDLVLDSETRWSNVTDSVRSEIERRALLPVSESGNRTTVS
jgi:hypothetical protein